MSLYSELGYGQKARVWYWSIAVLGGLAAFIGFQTEQEPIYFLIVAAAAAGIWFFAYSAFTVYDKAAESNFIRRTFKLGKGGSARFGGAGTYAKCE